MLFRRGYNLQQPSPAFNQGPNVRQLLRTTPLSTFSDLPGPSQHSQGPAPRGVPRGARGGGYRAESMRGAEKFQQCCMYFLQCSILALERPKVRTWKRQTCFLPRVPSNRVTPLPAPSTGCGNCNLANFMSLKLNNAARSEHQPPMWFANSEILWNTFSRCRCGKRTRHVQFVPRRFIFLSS